MDYSYYGNTYGYDGYNSAAGILAGSFLTGIIIGSLIVSVFAIIVMWKIFVKAGKPGWAAIVPFYNLYTLFEITWGNGWMFLTIFAAIVPILGYLVVLAIVVLTMIKLAKAFGKDTGFAVGLIFLGLIFMAILAFDSSTYLGAPKKDAQPVTPNNENTSAATSRMATPTPSVPIQPTMTPPTPIPTNNIGSVQPQTTEVPPVEENKTATTQATTYCPNCGAALQPGTEFCQNCGNKVTN